MSNDHIYVIIVPDTDQAAQVLATTRIPFGKHVAKHEPPSQRAANGKPASTRVPTGTPASTRVPTGKRAATRGAARPPPSKPSASVSSAPRRAGSGYVGGTDHHLRTWSVVVRDDKYDVTDTGAACGYRIDCNKSTVWTGTLGRRGSYHTTTTTLDEGTLKEVLRLVYVGDRRHAQARTPARAHAAPPSGPRTAKPASKRQAKRKAPASRPTPAPPPSGPRTREVKAKPAIPASQPRSAPPPHVEPKGKKRAKSTTRHDAAAPASRSSIKAKAKRHVKPKTTSASTHAGPLTQRTPVSQPSPKPSSRRAESRVDDTAVLNEIKKNLHEGDPSTAEQHFQVMKSIWMRGGREAAIAWKAQHKLASVVDAFDDWMEKNVEAARAMIGASPHSAPKHEHVA